MRFWGQIAVSVQSPNLPALHSTVRGAYCVGLVRTVVAAVVAVTQSKRHPGSGPAFATEMRRDRGAFRVLGVMGVKAATRVRSGLRGAFSGERDVHEGGRRHACGQRAAAAAAGSGAQRGE
ncbi:unnamed protein product [Lampetra planeri]